MDRKTTDANEKEIQEVKSNFKILGYKIQIPTNFRGIVCILAYNFGLQPLLYV